MMAASIIGRPNPVAAAPRILLGRREMGITDTMRHLLSLAGLSGPDIPAAARRMARLSLFDWMAVALAGRNEPVARLVRAYVRDEGGAARASLAGGGSAPARAAALVNGTVSHALDYDDTHFAHVGHPSVGVLPAALAAGEEADAPAPDVLDAFLLGAEASIRFGMVLGRGHYERGFHQTATAGAIGATVAAGRLYGLDEARLRHALSLVATRASGLKCQFGTMGKPFNAGIAAANGVEAAALAARGFVSCDDGLGGPQGFIDTHADAPVEAASRAAWAPGAFLFEDVKHKLHACCHGTHAMIEALLAAGAGGAIAAAEVRAIRLRVNPRWLRVCAIGSPRTGLEVKFSYAWLAAMVFHGIDTASDAAFTDALCTDQRLAALASRVSVEADAGLPDTVTEGAIALGSAAAIPIGHDLAATVPVSVLEDRLRHKACGLVGSGTADRLWAAVAGIDRLSARDLGVLLREAG